MQTIQLNDKIFTGPEKWNDLTRQNLIDLAKTMDYKGDQVFVNYVLVFLLFGIPKAWQKKLKRSQLDQMCETLDFLFEPNELGKWLIQSIPAGFITLRGPKDRLADLTTWEFVQVEAYYERYLVHQDDKFLDAFIAALYRRRRFSGEGRVPFNEDHIPARAEYINKLPQYLKTAIYLNYTGCRNLIVRLHPNLFSKGDPSESSSKASNQIIPWNDHVLSVSGGPLGDYEAVKKQKIWITLKHMDDLAKQRREAK